MHEHEKINDVELLSSDFAKAKAFFAAVFGGRFVFVAIAVLVAGTGLAAPAFAKNGFDLSNSVIDKRKILSGGPPRDGIPAIDNPHFVAAGAVDFLQDNDIVIGLVRGIVARAYPTRILVWHEVVNDTVAGDAVAVTYCPLCGTGMVFDRNIDGQEKSFGVSGLLFQSDVLLYDRESESLWSQLGLKAISGSAVGATLTWLPAEHLTWAAWKAKYPHSEVLSTNTGHRRNYGGQAYASYFASDDIMFPVPQTRRELPNKEKVIGVIFGNEAKAYPLARLPAQAITDTVGGQQIKVHYEADKQAVRITNTNGDLLPSVVAFWFAWQAFYPQTTLWQP